MEMDAENVNLFLRNFVEGGKRLQVDDDLLDIVMKVFVDDMRTFSYSSVVEYFDLRHELGRSIRRNNEEDLSNSILELLRKETKWSQSAGCI